MSDGSWDVKGEEKMKINRTIEVFRPLLRGPNPLNSQIQHFLIP